MDKALPLSILGIAGSLRQVLLGAGMPVLPRPEVMISQADLKFDLQGNLVDEKTAALITKLVARLVAWTRLLRG